MTVGSPDLKGKNGDLIYSSHEVCFVVLDTVCLEGGFSSVSTMTIYFVMCPVCCESP
jgi:hypothetical protein